MPLLKKRFLGVSFLPKSVSVAEKRLKRRKKGKGCGVVRKTLPIFVGFEQISREFDYEEIFYHTARTGGYGACQGAVGARFRGGEEP